MITDQRDLVICVSDDCHTHVNTDQVLSDEDLLAAAGMEDRRQVIRIRDVSPDVQIVDPSQVGRDWDTRRTVWGAKHPQDIPGGRLQQSTGVGALSPEVRASDIPPRAGAADLTMMVRSGDGPQVGRMETVPPSTPLDSGWMSPDSPQTVAFGDMADSSVPLSPNRVQVGKSQDVPDEGSLFHVSPVSPGFLMRPSGAAVQQPGAGVPLPQTLDAFTDPVLGDSIVFAQCALIPGSDAPSTLPVYTMPSGLAYMPGQSSVQTVLASAASSLPEGWSSDTPRTTDISREGPFAHTVYTSLMDTEDSPLVTTGLPDCPYRITSYTRPAVADTNPAFGLQLHHPRFQEFIGAPESARLLYHSPSFWVDRLGEEDAMAAAVNLQRDAGIMLLNLQILSQFVTSLHRMSSEMMALGMGRVVSPSKEIADFSTALRAPRAAKCMAAIGLWRPQTGPGDPGQVSASSGNACMNCRYCFPEGRLPPE